MPGVREMTREELRIGDLVEWDVRPSHGGPGAVWQGYVIAFGPSLVELSGSADGNAARWDVAAERLRPVRKGR